MRPTTLVPLAILLCAACGKKEETGDPEPADTDTDTDADTDTDTDADTDADTDFTPQEGSWTLTAGQITYNDCPEWGEDTGEADPESTVTVANTGAGTFTITDDEGLTHECTLTGQDYSCPGLLIEEVPIDGLEATLYVYVGLTGSFSDATTTGGESTGEVSCEGDNCDWIEGIPCSMVEAFSGTAD